MIRKEDGFELHWNRRWGHHREYACAAFLIAALLVAIYGNSFNCGFHLDDFDSIVENSRVHVRTLSWPNIQRALSGTGDFRRPLAYLTFGLDYYVHGTRLPGYHGMNLAFHYLAALFLFLLIYRTMQLPLLRKRYGKTGYAVALLAAVFWAAHPIQVGSVTYIVQRMSVMAGLFSVLALYLYLRVRTAKTRNRKILWAVLSVFSGLLAILSKENAVMLPVSLVLFELILIRGGAPGNWKKGVFALACAGGVVLFIGFLFTDLSSILNGYAARPFSLRERLLTEPRVILFYISLILYPTHSRLALLHDFEISTSLFHPWTTLPSIILIIGTIGVALVILKRRPLIGFSILFFFLNHIIEGSFIPLEIVFEHRNYLPSMFIFVPIVVAAFYLFDHFFYNRPIQLFAVATVTAILITQGHTTYMRNLDFHDELTLWQDNVRKAPHLHRPHLNLSKALLVAGRYGEGLAQMEAALEARAGGRTHQQYLTHYNLGTFYFLKRDYPLAGYHFRMSLDYEPNYPNTYNKLAVLSLFAHKPDEAMDFIREAIRRDPAVAEFYHTVGLILLAKGRPDAAIRTARKTILLEGDRGKSYFILGEAFRMKGDLARARLFFERYYNGYPEQLAINAALIEIYFLMHDETALRDTAAKMMCLAKGEGARRLLEAYDETYNFLDRSRIDRILGALAIAVRTWSDPGTAGIREDGGGG